MNLQMKKIVYKRLSILKKKITKDKNLKYQRKNIQKINTLVLLKKK